MMHNGGSDGLFMFLIVLFLAEMPIGVVQLIGALIRTIRRLNKGESIGNLKIYWIMVGVYFFVAGLLYFAYLYLVESIFDTVDPSTYYYEYYTRRADWEGIIMVSGIVWVALAWIIAIWYWKNVVFKRKPVEEIPNV